MNIVFVVILMALAGAISAQPAPPAGGGAGGPAAKPPAAAQAPAPAASSAPAAQPAAPPAPGAQAPGATKPAEAAKPPAGAQATESSKMAVPSSLIQSFADAATNPVQNEFVIRKAGEITFTTGVVIEGRVEKPQVMLILSKEALRLEPESFEKSFINKITRPLQYNAFEFMGEEKK